MVDVRARLEGATLNPDPPSWLVEGQVLLTIGYADPHGVYHQELHPFKFSRRLTTLPEGTGSTVARWNVTGVSVRGYQLHLAESGSDRSLTVDLALAVSPTPIHEGQSGLVELLAGEIRDTFTLLAADPRAPRSRLTSPRPVISALWGEVEVLSCRGGDGNFTIHGMVRLRWELGSCASETEFDESIPFIRVLVGGHEAEAAWEVYAGIARIRLEEERDGAGCALVEVALWGIGKRLVPAVSRGGTAAGLAAKSSIPEKPTGERPMAENPIAAKFIAGKFVAEKPIAENPIAENPIAENPIAENPVAEDPIAEDPIAEDPIAEVPVVRDLRTSITRVEGEAMPDRAVVHIVAETEVLSAASGGEVTYRQFSVDGTWLLPIRGLRSRDKVEASATVKQVLAVRTPTGELRGARLFLRVEAMGVRREPRRMPDPDPRGRRDREVWLVDTLVGQSARDVVLMVEFRQGASGLRSDSSSLVPVRVGRWEHEIRIAWPLPEEANAACAFRADIEDLEAISATGHAVLEGTAFVHWRTAVRGAEGIGDHRSMGVHGTVEKRVNLELDCPGLKPHLQLVCFWEPRELGIQPDRDGSPAIELRVGLTLVAYRNEVYRLPLIPGINGTLAVLIEGGAAGIWAEDAIRLAGPVWNLDLALGRPESAIDGIFLVWKAPVILRAIPASGVKGQSQDEAGREAVGSVVAQGHLRARGLPDKPVWRFIPSICGVTFSDDGHALISISAVARYFAVRGTGGVDHIDHGGWGSHGRSERQWEQTVVFDLERQAARVSDIRAFLQETEGGGRIKVDLAYVTSDSGQRHRRIGIPLQRPCGAQRGPRPRLIAYQAQMLRAREPASIRLTFCLEPATGAVSASRRSEGYREE